MNPECRLNSARSTPRIQQPRRTLSPPEYAAAGDAPRGQMSLDLNLGTPIETLTMDTSLLSTTTKDADDNAKSKFNNSCAHPNAGRVFNLFNEPVENVRFVIEKKSSSIRCRFSSKKCSIEENSDHLNAVKSETPRKECSHDTSQSGYYGNLADNELKSLTNVIGTSEEGDQRNSTEDYSVDKILSPKRKVSMFSAEIWAEKGLPIDTFVCPEPELVEIYFDKNKTTGELNRFRDYSTESIDVSATWRSSYRGVLGRNILLSPPPSARKSRTSSSGQKTVNFDDEIWPVCPVLIPSGKEFSDFSVFETRYEVIPPEKLNKNSEEIASVSRIQTNLVKSTDIFRVTSRASTNQYDLEDIGGSVRAIEPTHETEEQSDFGSIGSQAKKSCENNLRTETSRASISAVEKVQSFCNVDKISCEESPVMDVLREIDNTDCQMGPRTTWRLENVDSSKQETSTLRKDPLSASDNESMSTMLGNIPNQRGSNSLYEAKSSVVSSREVLSWEKIGEKKRKREKCDSMLPTISKQIDFLPVENDDFIYHNFEKTISTPTDIICAISRKSDELLQSLGLGSQREFREKSAESISRNQSACHKINIAESQVKPIGSKSASKLQATELRNAQKSIVKQETKKNRQCVKMVRFRTCGRHSNIKINGSDTKLQAANLEDRDSMSVDSFKKDIDQFTVQIARQIERDSTSDDAVETLAKIEIIVEANRQTAERLQKLQPHVVIPRLMPPEAGKSIAKALMRCRNYMQTNGYSRAATNTLNKLLMNTVQSLKQSVDRQKLALAQEKRRAISEDRSKPKRMHQANFLYTNGVLTADDLAGNQVQCLISDILKVTKTIVPKLNGEETPRKCSVVPNCSHSSVRNVTTNIRTPADTTGSKTDTTNFTKGSKVSVDAYERKVTHAFGTVQPNKVDEVVRNCFEKPITIMFSEPPSNQFRGNHRDDKESSISTPSYPKKKASTDPMKTSKKLFNELWEKRSKTLPRHSTVNDSTNNLQSLTGPRNAPINQKLPVWKPGGNNFNHPSMSVITNSKKIRPAPTSVVVRTKNTAIEHTRSTKLHRRTKTTPGIIKDTLKTIQKSIPHNASSQGKIKTVAAKGHDSEVVSLDRSKVQVTSEIDETGSKKPRSKSRTRTKPLSKISKLTVTEIPLEHVEAYSTLLEREIPATKELPLSRKVSSSPKDIILMLEELIKSSGDETTIQNARPVHVVARCDVAVNDVNKEIDHVTPTKSEVKPMKLTNLTPVNEKDDQELAENRSIQMKSVEEKPKESTIDIEVDDNQNLCDKETPSLPDTVADPSNLHREFSSTMSSNVEEVFAVARSNSETSSDDSMERPSELTVSNIERTAEMSSESSIGSVSSKCCQASMTSLMTNEISEEWISDRISDAGANSCCEGSAKSSNKSFDSVEDGKVAEDNFAEQFQRNKSTSASSNTTTKKKFVNRHAKSLEMLKEILSDQGLGIHLLSRAENELRDRCKSGSNKRGLTARRSLQGGNLTTSRVEENYSTTLIGRLASLSESENTEVGTMTSGNNPTKLACKFDSYSSKEDKALMSKVVTVENATQFDVTLKSDMCVGDGIIYKSSAPFILECAKMSTEKISAVCSSPVNFESANLVHEIPIVVQSESVECKLPNEILNAFKLAADRATNLYAAVNILRGNMGSESTIQANSSLNVDSNETLRHVPAPRPLTSAIDKPSHVRSLSEAFDASQKSYILKTVSPTKIIIPRILTKVNEVTKCKEPMTKSDDKSTRSEIIDRSVPSVKEANEYTTGDKSQNAYHPNSCHRIKPLIPPKPSFADRKAFGMTIGKKYFEQKQSINPNPALNMKIKSPDTVKVFQSAVCQSPSSRQQSLVEGSATEKRIETLHFAGRQAAPVVRSTSNVQSEGTIIQSDANRPLNANLPSLRSSRIEEKNGESFTRSRIRTLLHENLQRFNIEYDPIIHEKAFEDFRDRLLSESSDDDVLVDKVFAETTTSTSYTSLEDCNTLSEVKDLVNCLLNGVEVHRESAAVTKVCDPHTQSPRYRRIRKPVRRLKSERTKRVVKYGKRPMLCGKYWSILSGMLVSRDHLLSLVYAIICSFVFCCLQFSVHCEV